MSSRVRFSQERPGITYVPSSHTNSSTNLISNILSKPMPRKRSDKEYEMDVCTAASIGDEKFLKILLEKNPNSLISKNKSGWTPLLYSAYLGHNSVCAFLIDHGARVEERNHRQQTALMMAAACGNLNVVRLLLERGANPNLVDFEQRQALHYAASCSQNVVVDVLLASGADPNAQDLTGLSPFHEAAISGHELTFLSLLEKGGSLTLKNGKDEDCAALACDNPKILQIIRESRREFVNPGGPGTLAELLDEMDLARYADQFKNENIDLNIFFDLRKEDLDDMKIAYGPKKRMLDVIEKYQQTGVVRTDIFVGAGGSASPNGGDKMAHTLKLIKEINQSTKKYALDALEAMAAGQSDKLRDLLISLIDSVEQIAVKVSSHA